MTDIECRFIKNPDCRRLYVMEGPAGSGKSHLIRECPDLFRPLPTLFSDMPRPRSYVGKDGIVLSGLKDFMSGLSFVSASDSNQHRYIVDRWVLSQLVYGSIRSNTNMNALDITYQVMTQLIILRNTFSNQAARSGKLMGYPPPMFIGFIILLPDADLLEQQRKSTTKSYPYPGWRELECYSRIIEYAQLGLRNTYTDLCVKFIGIKYKDVSQRDSLPGLLRSIVSHWENTNEPSDLS